MTARRVAVETLLEITEDDAYANLCLKHATAKLNGRDAAFVYALVYAALEHLITIDWILAGFVQGRQNRTVRSILRLGCCELLYLATPPHAAVSEYVTLCRNVGKGALSGMVNGVLRSVDRNRAVLPRLPEEPIQRLSIQYSYPEWLVAEWVDAYGAIDAEAMLAVRPFGTEVRAQWPETSDALASALPVACERGRWDANCLRLTDGMDVAAHPLFIEGRMSAQSQSAMLACRALGDCRGKTVLDACAAPGGKSAYLYSLCEGDVQLTAWDIHAHRVALMQNTFERLRVRAVSEARDASVFDPTFSACFDAVLLDAPCSGLGLIHEQSDIRYRRQPESLDELALVQRAILTVCARYVRPGGVLVYATCTISKRENERQIEAFLSENPGFSLEPLPLPIENSGTLQLFPHVHGVDGFYYARMRRCI